MAPSIAAAQHGSGPSHHHHKARHSTPSPPPPPPPPIIKTVQVPAPRLVLTDVEHFRALVQEMTGHLSADDAAASAMEEGKSPAPGRSWKPLRFRGRCGSRSMAGRPRGGAPGRPRTLANEAERRGEEQEEEEECAAAPWERLCESARRSSLLREDDLEGLEDSF